MNRLFATFSASTLALGLSAVSFAAAPRIASDQVLYVHADSTSGTVAGDVLLTETNAPAGQAPTFVLLAGNDAGAFALEAAYRRTNYFETRPYTNYVGQLNVAAPSALADTKVFSLTVGVTDGAGGDTNTVLVKVYTPQVLLTNRFEVAENANNGTSVARLAVTNETAVVSFALDAGSTSDPAAVRTFDIEPDGDIVVLDGTELDYESRTEFEFAVEITDNQETDEILSITLETVTVALSDVNEPPEFKEQGFELPPEGQKDSRLGAFRAVDPEGDTLAFEILKLEVQDEARPNSFFVVRNGNELHLADSETRPDWSACVLTVRATDEASPPNAVEARILIRDPATYSRFGVPLLAPLPGHGGGTGPGLPVQAVANGPDGAMYVAGLDEFERPYVDLYPEGFDGDVKRVLLPSNFVPTALGATSERVYVLGSDVGTDTAVVFMYSAEGIPQKSNDLHFGAYRLFNVADLVMDGGDLYICGAWGSQPSEPLPYWATLDGESLEFSAGSPHLIGWNALGVAPQHLGFLKRLQWGVATSIAKEAGQEKVYVGGYWRFEWDWYDYANGWDWFWGRKRWHTVPSRCAFLEGPYPGTPGNSVKRVSASTDPAEVSNWVFKDVVVAKTKAGSTYVYSVTELAERGRRNLFVEQFAPNLTKTEPLRFISSTGDVRGESLTVSSDHDEPALYLTGVLPGGPVTTFDDGGLKSTLAPSVDRFFLARMGMDLKLDTTWSPPLLLSEFNYVPTGGRPARPLGAAPAPSETGCAAPLSIVLPHPAKDGVLVAGNIGSGTLTLRQSGNANSVSAVAGNNAGFLTVVKHDKTFEIPLILEIESEFGVSEKHVLPHRGKRIAQVGKTYTVQVPREIYVDSSGVYMGSLAQPPSEVQIRDTAVTRYVCTGYTIADTEIIGDSNTYTFVFTENRKITFHWRIEHALEIRSDLSGTQADGLGLSSTAAGNPLPNVKKHWIPEDELVTAAIDGWVIDPGHSGTRYIVTGYVGGGAAIGRSYGWGTRMSFPAVEARQQVGQFTMRNPATIEYTWGIQHRVQTSTSSLESQDRPGIKDLDSETVRAGSGEFWFDRGSRLLVGAQDLNGSLRGALLATGDLAGRIANKDALDTSFTLTVGPLVRTFRAKQIPSLAQETTVVWDYGDEIYPQTVRIGEAVDLSRLPAHVAAQVNGRKPPRVRIVEGPSGSTGEDMHEWDQVAYLSYPVRPGRFFQDWEKKDPRLDKDGNPIDFVILEITSEFPPQAHYRHLTHPDLPAVELDPDGQDGTAFVKLEYTSGNGTVDEHAFTATQAGTSVLLFSDADPAATPFEPASGDLLKESLRVRVVRTWLWDDPEHGFDKANPPPATLAHIGAKLASAKDTANLGTGFVVYPKARYNARIHDRAKVADAGPIIPVNRHFLADLTADLVVLWYEEVEGLWWPYSPERFDPQWPLPLAPDSLPDPLPDVETMVDELGNRYLRRIVIASRLGSEGKDVALRDQLCFAPPRYEQVAVYHQPDPDLPGYNPNEEHALLAPSFKFLDRANPPPAAYALRNDLNQTSPDAEYTSDPHVLVEYLDHGPEGGPGEFKMAVYTIEKEDDHPLLNPYRYPETSPSDPSQPSDQREFPYTFDYPMKAGEPVQPPYPLGMVIGLTPCRETWGENLTPARVYWEDHRGSPWAVSAGSFRSTFHYPPLGEFWVPESLSDAACLKFETAGSVQVTGRTPWPVFGTGQQFLLNGELVEVLGEHAGAFASAVNDHAQLSGRVTAMVLPTGEIRIRSDETIIMREVAGGPLAAAGFPASGTIDPTPAVRYTAEWPTVVPILKAGETLTYAGGEYKADHSGTETPGLPGVLGWAAGEIVFDSLNPTLDNRRAFQEYTARLISPLEERTVTLTEANAGLLREEIQPSTGITQPDGTRWYFAGLPASLAKRVFYDPFSHQLGCRGFVNDKTLGDGTLTAAPPPVYVLEPSILTSRERETLQSLATSPGWQDAVERLYAISRNPAQLRMEADDDAEAAAYYVGLEADAVQEHGQDKLDEAGQPIRIPQSARHQKGLGPGLALVPSPQFLDPANPMFESYLTLVENNHPDLGGPVTLHIIKVSKRHRYRGAIQTLLSENVFDEHLTLRHSGDFGGNLEDLVYQWFYRAEDGTEAPLPPGGPWRLVPDQGPDPIRGLGMFQIHLEGVGGLLLSDNLFFARYRHRHDLPLPGPNATDWAGTEWDRYGRFHRDENDEPAEKVGTHWAGAANSPSVDGEYRPQLAMGWIKRVLDRINPYEARISDFRDSDAPATYASMIQELGPRYEGPVALNPDKDVVENVGLIELYETVLDRGRKLSIDLSSPLNTPGINSALLLAATRLSDFYMLLGNEAYADAQTPTVGFGDEQIDFAGDYGTIASSMFAFQNQQPSLLEEELALLRGLPDSYGRPVYTRLFWNFTKSLGEVAYVMNYNITDKNHDGFIDESDAMQLYPQGHGDAWGHYLSALKHHYRLLQHAYFNWVSRAERYNLQDVVIDVDYLDERKFAEAAAARAKAGAEIVNLTYRSRYVEDPDGQWQGYTDLDPDRAWGVEGWARRAGQGAYFDWIAANALIPPASDHLEANALERIDRETVTSLRELSAELGEIQSVYDDANAGLNPLGLARDVVPFDIDATFNAVGSTAQIGRPAVQGMTHFIQIYERAVAALNNARAAFENANLAQSRLRQVSESVESFRLEVIEADLDYRNRLIEIFGTPYAGTIGTGQPYPAGYRGPDLMLWMYVDVNGVNNESVPPPSLRFTNTFAGFTQQILDQPAAGAWAVDDFKATIRTYFVNDLDLAATTDADLFDEEALTLADLPIAASGYSFRAPDDWGTRASPGELQLMISELVQAEAGLALALKEYQNAVLEIEDMSELLAAKHGVAAETIAWRNVDIANIATFSTIKLGLGIAAGIVELAGETAEATTDAAQEASPKTTPTVGTSNSVGDAFSAVRAAIKAAGAYAVAALKKVAQGLLKKSESIDDLKDIELTISQKNIDQLNLSFEIHQELKHLEQLLRRESALRIEFFRGAENLRELSDRYRTALEGGLRLLEQRQVFNIKAAGVTQRHRYQDMAFRVFRSDALQKYRAAFDLASRYVYLAAQAYDYETNLAPEDRGAAQSLLTEIVRARTLGVLQEGEPTQGGGLAGVLATLRDNFDVLKGRMSFNNPQFEDELFSLRREMFRIQPDPANDDRWRQTLKQYRVADLWELPEFRRYCRPPAPRSAGALPGLVIPFGTEILFGRNFFGWPLGAGDHAYDPSVFATKIQSAAVYFDNYQVAHLAATPRVYLVPAGLDVMTIPTSAELETREWTVVDQAIPVPHLTGSLDLADPNWMPVHDSLSEPWGQIRRYSSFRAKALSAFDPEADSLSYDTRLIGRSVWNTRWLLIIPGGHMLADADAALDTFIDGAPVLGDPETRDLDGVKDILLLFHTYGYSGN